MRTTALSRTIVIAGLLLALASVGAAQEPADPVAVFKTGDYKKAIPYLQSAVAKTPKDPVLCAALLSALVYEARVDEATDAYNQYETLFPDSPEVIAARGEFAFYMGDMPEAEKLFRAASKQKEETARAAYGLYRLYYSRSMYRTARLLCLRAHQIDPDDALISLAFLRYLVPEKRKEEFGPFMQAHPWFFGNCYVAEVETSSEVRSELAERHAFEIDGAEPAEITVPLVYIRNGPNSVLGVGLDMSIQGGRPLRMLFDTGASGILLTQAAVDKAGLNHIGSVQTRGIGDKGSRNGFIAVSESCGIGTLKYKTCIFRALEGKGRVAGPEQDGLIGADFFSNYIVQIDFQKRTLHLTPQPKRTLSPQGYDRDPQPNEVTWSPVFRFGPHLYMLTRVNGKRYGLFLLDTGSTMSMIDSSFARLSTKIHSDSHTRVKGISGEVSQIFEADKAEIEFARFRQRIVGLTSFNLNNSAGHEEIRMSGIMGIPLLSLFRLTLDYRNGLVNFDYILK